MSCGETNECRGNEEGLKLEDSHGVSLMSVGSKLTGEVFIEKRVDKCGTLNRREEGRRCSYYVRQRKPCSIQVLKECALAISWYSYWLSGALKMSNMKPQ